MNKFKLTRGHGKDYTNGCMLDYDCIKNNHRVITVDLSWKRELDANPKAIQQIESVEQLKNDNN